MTSTLQDKVMRAFTSLIWR